MLAELHYSEMSANLVNILNDMAKVMTGTTNVNLLSSVVDKQKSSLTGAAGDWVQLTCSDAVDIAGANGGEARLFRNTCAYTNTIKYFKFASGALSTNTVMYYGVDASLVSNSTSPAYTNRLTAVANQLTTVPSSYTTMKTASSSGPLVVKMFVSRELVLINFGASGTSLGNTPLIIMDYPPEILFPVVPLVNTVIDNKLTRVAFSGTNYFNGTLSFSYGPFTHTNIFNSILYKNEGFVSTGTLFWLIPLGIRSMTINSTSYQINWYNASDALKMWITNVNAFGNNGDTFRTALGNLCKFGPYMVEVR